MAGVDQLLVNTPEYIPQTSACKPNVGCRTGSMSYKILNVMNPFFLPDCENIYCCKLTPLKSRETQSPCGPISS